MQKAIYIENTGKNVERVLSMINIEDIESNPTDREYIIIEDYTEPPILDNELSVNYPMYDKVNQVFKWVQVKYFNTATEELLQIENLKIENVQLQSELNTANENINMLLELQADILGGAI